MSPLVPEIHPEGDNRCPVSMQNSSSDHEARNFAAVNREDTTINATTGENSTVSMEQGPQPPIAGIAQRLANLRQRPCLVYCGDIPHELDKTAIRSVADALPGDSLDVP